MFAETGFLVFANFYGHYQTSTKTFEILRIASSPLLSHNFSEQRKLRIHNRFSHLRYEVIVENFV